MPDRGRLLYRLVEAYAALGDHRSGTDVDDATRAWFVSELTARGADVTEVPYDFPRYEARSRLDVAGREVASIPLWYSGEGRVDDTAPSVHALEVLGGYLPIGLDDLLGTERVMVLATTGATGRLIALNRDVAPGRGPLVVLAPGSELDALAAGPTRLTAEAQVVPGRSATVVGRLGRRGPPLVLTTPLSGWFACAGERGTGIALALELATALAEEVPVVVVGTTGHEVGHLGARHWLQQAAPVGARAVLHLGASAAAGQPPTAYSPLRFAMTTLADGRRDAMASALEGAGLPLRDMGAPWPGEGEEWRSLGAPVLSVTGAFEQFHTPDDLPSAVTSPGMLDRAYEALLAATRRLLDQPTS